jgi:hypothetical protein
VRRKLSFRFAFAVPPVVLALVAACAELHAPPTAPRVAAPITGPALLDHVKFLASDALEGRMTGEPGCELAAKYVAEQFAADGLEPGGDPVVASSNGTASGRSWFQHFDAMAGRSVQKTTSARLGGRELKLDQEFAVAIGMGTSNAKGELVFAGYGIQSQEPKRDDYAGIDAADKIVVVVSGAPGRTSGTGDYTDTKPAGRFARARAKVEIAFARKAAGLVIVQNPLDAEKAEKLPPWESDRGDGLTFAAIHVTASVGRELLAKSGVDLDAAVAKLEQGENASQSLRRESPAEVAGGGTLVLTPNGEVRIDTAPIRRPTSNVVAVLRGDGSHGDEHLVVGAHYDHLGWGGSSSLSSERAIHHGADDNASGTAAMLEVARHCATGPRPPRTIVFLAFSGEELGLLGSQHYTAHPLLPLPSCFAMLNMDMVGRSQNGYCAVGAIGSSPGFKGLAERANESEHLGLKLELSDGGMAQGSSDHQSFLNAGVPSLFFFSGLHEDYHKPSDTWDKIAADGAASIAKLCDGVLEEVEALPTQPKYAPLAPPVNPHLAAQRDPNAPKNPDAKEPEVPVVTSSRPWFGSIPSFGASGEGVLFDGVSKGSPAEKAGILKGDRLVEWNGRAVKTLEDFTALLDGSHVGETVKAVVLRKGERKEFEVVLALRP